MTGIKIITAAAGATLACALAATAQAAPREGALIEDLTRALVDVCLPAQASEQDAATYIGKGARKLGLTRTRFSNTTKAKSWRLSTDARAFVFSNDDLCYASVKTRTTGGERLTADLHDALSAFSVVEPAVMGDVEAPRFSAGYCTQMSDGSLASYNLQSTVADMEPGTGRITPGLRRVVIVSAPRVSECGGGE